MHRTAKVTSLIAKWKLRVKSKNSVDDIENVEEIEPAKPEPEKYFPTSFTRQLAFNDAPTGIHPTSSFYSDYRSNILAKVAVVVILSVTGLLFIIFALKNRHLDAIVRAQFDRIDEENRLKKLADEAIMNLNLTRYDKTL